VQQCIKKLLERQKLIRITSMPQPQLYMLPTIRIETQQVGLLRQELAQDTNTPSSLPHQRLHT
jgi:hypothetical protein